jgi:hypothetical protein
VRGSIIAGILCATAATLGCLELPPPLPTRLPDLGVGDLDAAGDGGVDGGPVDADVGGAADADGGSAVDADGGSAADADGGSALDADGGSGPERPSFPPPGLEVRAYHVGSIDRDSLDDLVIADHRAQRIYTFLGRTAFMRVIDQVDTPVVPPAAVLIADVVSPSNGSVVPVPDGTGDVWVGGESGGDGSNQAVEVLVGASQLRRTRYVMGADLGAMSGTLPGYLAIGRVRPGVRGVYFGGEFHAAVVELGDVSSDVALAAQPMTILPASGPFTPYVHNISVRSSTVGAYDDLLLLREAGLTVLPNPGDGDYTRARPVDAAYGAANIRVIRHVDLPVEGARVGDGCADVVGAWIGDVVVMRMPCSAQPRFLGPYRASVADDLVDLNVGDVGGSASSPGVPDVVMLRRDGATSYLSVLPDVTLRNDMTLAPSSPALRRNLAGAPQIVPLVEHDGVGARSIVVVWGDRAPQCFELAGVPLAIVPCARW